MSEQSPVAPGAKPHLDPFEHVVNNDHIEIFETIHLSIGLPNILGYQITKFHVLLTLAAFIVTGLLIWLARQDAFAVNRRVGKFVNLVESFVFFIRDPSGQART